MKVFSITNNKGGTGKTTTTLNLGAALAQKGFKVLLIDLDAQCNLSIAAGFKNNQHHIGELLVGEATFEETIVRGEHMDLLPSSRLLLSFEYRLNVEPDSGYFLKEQLEGKEYDYVLIDCPPSLGTFTINALVASNYFIVPIQGENFAYVGLDEILQLTAKIKKRMNPNIKLGGILMNKYDMRTKFSQMVYAKLVENQDITLYKTNIRQDVSLMECTAFSKSIFEYSEDSRGAADFKALCEEVLLQN
jgi:chromosome partitioning protein